VSIRELSHLLKSSGIRNSVQQSHNEPIASIDRINNNDQQSMKSSFTDVFSITNYGELLVVVQKLKHIRNITIYQLNVTNENDALMRYFESKKLSLLHSKDEADKFIIERLTNSERIELKFDRYLKLESIAIDFDSQVNRTYSVVFVRINPA